MRIKRVISVVDSHTAGEPTRVVIAGFPYARGATMAERRDYLIAHYDHLRRLLMLEPRGHKDMFGAVLTPPERPDSDLGAVFMDGEAYKRMCGHGSIGVVTVAIQMGIVEPNGSKPVVTLDTPAGRVTARPTLSEDGDLRSVGISGIPSYPVALDVTVPGREIDPRLPASFPVDIAVAGSTHALVRLEEWASTLDSRDLSEWASLAMKIRAYLNSMGLSSIHDTPGQQVGPVQFDEPLRNTASGAQSRNLVIFGLGQVDRSPCGTGTLARLSVLHARGQLGMGTDLRHESILGTSFSARILEEVEINGREGIVGQVEGSAHITSFSSIVLEEGDPFPTGFSLDNRANVTT